MSIRRLYLGVDRQDYAVNWTQREDRRNTVISAVSSVDNESGYCFGLHLNSDPNLVADEVEKAAHDAKDYAVFPPFRQHARIWLEQDYVASMKKRSTLAAATSLRDRVAKAYAQAQARADVEARDAPGKDEKLPAQGMQIHSEYTLYAHFMHIKRLTAGVEKIRFFLDQDSGMRAACLAAFAHDIKVDRRVDAFFVRIAQGNDGRPEALFEGQGQGGVGRVHGQLRLEAERCDLGHAQRAIGQHGHDRLMERPLGHAPVPRHE